MASSVVVRVVFVTLAVATLAAFFVTERLERSPSLLRRVYIPQFISPNGDGERDAARVSFALRKPDEVTVSIVDGTGAEVRRLAERLALGREVARFAWDGRTQSGAIAPEGPYRVSVALRSERRSVIPSERLVVDSTPPKPAMVSVTPSVLSPEELARGATVRAVYSGRGQSDYRPVFTVYRTDAGAPRPVASFPGKRFRYAARWHGRVGGRPVPEGVYAFAVTARDAAGNAATAPRLLPPPPDVPRPGTGVTVRSLTAAGPLEPVRPGAIVPVRLDPPLVRVRWSLTRVGARRAIASGRGDGRRLVIAVPPRTGTGLFLARLEGGRRRAVLPLVVTGRPLARARRRVMVVLPSISWQGSNRVDADRDGLPDTLDRTASVALDRPFALGRPPPGFEGRVAPLMRFLDRARVPYELTTDLALARGTAPTVPPPGVGPPPAPRGVVFAGSERWLPERIQAELRTYVEAGGRVASFGTDAFRRRVTVSPSALFDPGPPAPTNAFGERTSALETLPAPMVATGDRIGLFAGTDGVLGLFSRFEQSEERPPETPQLASAGRSADRPALIVYGLGRGLVARAGSPDWSRALATRADVAQVTRRLLALVTG